MFTAVEEPRAEPKVFINRFGQQEEVAEIAYLKENWGIKFAHISKADCGKH
jgi:hypothetical protein